jgi:hypothetical protein
MNAPPVPIPSITLTSYHYAAVMHWLRSQLRLYKGAAVKILWVVADRTFGHRKWEDVIALSQFAFDGGIGRDTVLATLADLLAIGIIRRRPVGNSYAYRLNIPEDLFSDRPDESVDTPVENATALIHSEREAVSFFAENSEGYPQNEGSLAGSSSSQIENVTEYGNGWNRVVEILTALTDLNDTLPRATYALRNLPRWAHRAVMLGMHWGDVWTLWQACCRVGRNPVALFLHRLTHDGTLPIGKPPKVRDATKQLFAEMLD